MLEIRALLDAGRLADARARLRALDDRYGGLAASASVELATRLSPPAAARPPAD